MATVRKDKVQIELDIDGSQSKTELDNLTRKAGLLKEDLKGLKKGTQEYIDKNKEISQVNTRMAELQKQIGLSSLSYNQLNTLSRQLNRELRDLAPGTESFIQKSKQLQEVDTRFAEVKKEIRGIDDELEKSGNGMLNFLKKSVAFTGIQLGIESLVGSLKALASESIDAAAKGSDSIADMEKSLNLSTEQARALREQLEGIDTRTSQENLEGIAIAAGQLGVAADRADEFTESVDQAVVALGDEFTGGVDDVTKSIGGLQKLFKETKEIEPDKAITKIGSALNALGADGSATSPVIAEFTSRIGQLGDLAPEITQTLGLGAAFQELGLSAEISSGGVTNVLLTASKETGKFAQQLGLTEKEFTKLLNSDPNEMLLRLAESLKGASNTEIVSTLDKLGIKSQEATKVVSLLANQTDIVRQKQALAAAEFEKGTSLLEEFKKKNTNAAAEIDKSEKAFARYRRELGEFLIPIYIKALQTLGLFIEALKAAPEFLSENRALLLALGVALFTLNLHTIRATASTLAQLAVEKGRAVATRASAAAQWLLNAAMSANPIGMVVAAVALLVGGLITLYERSERVRETFAGLSAVATLVFNNIKQVAIDTLGSVGKLLLGVFTGNIALIRSGISDLKGVGAQVSEAYHKGFQEREQQEHAKQAQVTEQRNELRQKQAKKAAEKEAEVDRQSRIDALKLLQADLELRLSKTKEGSEQELKLKQQLVLVARDLELEGEKKSAADKAVIRGKAQVELNKLNQAYAKQQAEEAKKAAAEALKQAEIEAEAERANLKRRADLEKDAYKRRAAELRAAAVAEAEKLKGTEAQIAEGRRLIAAKLEQDLLRLAEERVEQETAILRRIEQVDADIAVRRAERASGKASASGKTLLYKGGEAEEGAEKAAKAEALRLALEEDLANDRLTLGEKLALQRKYLEDRDQLDEDFTERAKKRERDKVATWLELSSQAIQLVQDFQKIATDKELTKIDKDKKARLQKLELEFAAGKLSKEQYEQQKVGIETNYSAQSRAIKKKAAETEKSFNVAQGIIQGTLAVLKAAPSIPLMVATGILAAGAVAKIIATPIPEFARGGVVGAPRPGWRERVRQFAQGGRINSTAGVADVGQRHSGGGIRMVDGATGEHLGEWERGEPYMILSRDTYANNKELVDDLIDTSLYRGGAPVQRRKGGGIYAEDGAVVGGGTAAIGKATSSADPIVAAVDRNTEAINRLPTRLRIAWEEEDTGHVEDELAARRQLRNSAQVN
ncbi:hypothetical protein LJY25_08105 [Hymenobacter sp. BT175]|uniref:hypothetical protein n=1 Tax=Hymenobacter translucens TaxID=2886507 RepID=UPI001D0E1677|nr:hypothetical protein [Hymenobacter translucens]MCC2546404.1 hypothetical protein [Hymenobacter translucens]